MGAWRWVGILGVFGVAACGGKPERPVLVPMELPTARPAADVPTAAPTPDPRPATAFRAGEVVEVEWQGSWFEARVLQVLPGPRYQIHYEGYGDDWDESVGPDRIRAPQVDDD